MFVRRVVVTALVAAWTLLGAALPAAADHTHVKLLGNGRCVILAAKGGEKYVELPRYQDSERFAANRRHPSHVKVHLGEPGDLGEGDIYVKDSPQDRANCQGYVND